MNAKEWLIREFEINKDSKEHHAFLTLFETSIPLMERYASYREKELRYKIFEFRNKLKDIDCSPGGNIGMQIDNELFMKPLKEYFDEHFNIKNANRRKTIRRVDKSCSEKT